MSTGRLVVDGVIRGCLPVEWMFPRTNSQRHSEPMDRPIINDEADARRDLGLHQVKRTTRCSGFEHLVFSILRLAKQ